MTKRDHNRFLAFVAGMLFAGLLLCSCTARGDDKPLSPWGSVGSAIEYCGGIGYQYDMMTKFESVGAELILRGSEGNEVTMHSPDMRYDCNVYFMRLTGHGRMAYLIGLAFKFYTPEAEDAWSDMAQNVKRAFCAGTKSTPVYGFVKIEGPEGLVQHTHCERVEDLARTE